MARKTRTLKLGVKTAFFGAEYGRKTETDIVDLQKVENAAKGYKLTIEEVGNLVKDDRYEDFISVAQQALSELDSEGRDAALAVLKWHQENKPMPMVGVVRNPFDRY